ncbi:actin-like ATPase domain-containing protein [Penicillium mononematosum]|uniref:actin-like ATPase domain-containing protein n=1 Tax=Penicillium mononematosum TaxID=268346 RepID=UPI002546CB4A|nr:actin-like ATPase domain-containing protein [Penicillium mononematosum]KAJ6191023.1 actin-like ATPase domain-containing protein [Penicillium mononematosum]
MSSSIQHYQPPSISCNLPNRIIIGLDYGTSGTGNIPSKRVMEGGTALIKCHLGVRIYFVEDNVATPEEHVPWPSGGDQLKVPSRIAYPVDNPSFTMLSPCWGFTISPDMRAYSLTKLFLDSNTADFDDQVLKQRLFLGNPDQVLHPDKNRAPVDIVTDYLSHVLNFVWRALQNKLGLELNSLPVVLQFSVPATWSEQGQRLSRHAVLQAWDFRRPQDRLTMMSEPEAAAKNWRRDLGVRLWQWDSGAKCGGAAIDSRLFDLMRTRLPQQAFKHLNYLIGPGGEFMTEFEKVKRNFQSPGDGPFHLPLRIRRGRAACRMPYFNQGDYQFILTGKDVQSLFDGVIRNIIGLINSQMTAADRECGRRVINKLVLVGGLASSPYLQSELHMCFGVGGRMLYMTVSPGEPTMAVAHGSALAAMHEIEVRKVRSPRHYGVGCPGHPEADIEWVIVKDEPLEQGRIYTRRYPWSHQLYQEGHAQVMTIPLYSCELSSPPPTTRFSGVTLEGFILVDFSCLELGLLHRGGATSRMLYEPEDFVKYIFYAENRTLNFGVEQKT